ncbi:MAG: chemotaxis response regulator protein-glutamate methylesterase [Treponema sp.]|nr:chemotaxis response regulator protein-glutamate methylesterase [Treponema sp.]
MSIKVLIIDDSALVRETMTSVLSSDPEIVVIGTAPDPIIGVRKINQNRPDVIILDIEMARMDGLTFLRKLNETIDPIPCVICSTMVSEGSPNAIKALEYGACSIIQKPALGTRKFIEESKILISDAVKSAYQSTGKLKKLIPSQIGGSTRPSTQEKKQNQPYTVQPKLTADVILQKPTKGTIPIDTTERIIVVGASTGGTEALKDLLSALPGDTPGMVIVQHMPEHFTKAFAGRLNGLSKMTVKEAENGDKVQRGLALIAPGNKHTLLKRSGKDYYVEVRDGPLVSRHRPSVDVLFRSAARYAGKNAVGVIMTGMGDDGAKGMKEMHDAGAYTIAQDEASCIVFGMPAEAIKNGGVDKIVPLQSIAKTLISATIIH